MSKDKLKIVCISDTHTKHNKVEIPRCDILIHAGDSTSYGYSGEVYDFILWLDRQPAKHKCFIAGNHDYLFQERPDEAAEILQKFNVNYLLDSFVELEGLKIYGSPWQPWFYDWAFNFDEDDDGTQAFETWSKIPHDTDILVTHGPAYGVLDRVIKPMLNEDPHVGCKHLLGKIMSVGPALHVCGHIHEDFGQKQNGDTLFINASICNKAHMPVNPPTVVYLEKKDGKWAVRA